jgi:hypothetical protein
MTTTENSTTPPLAATFRDDRDGNLELAGRIQALDVIAEALITAEADGSEGMMHDPNEAAMVVLEELERRLIGVAPEGHLLFAVIADEKERARAREAE